MKFDNKQQEKVFYEYQARVYARANNLRTYRIDGQYMIYNISRQGILGIGRETIQYKVNLNNMQVDTIKPLKKFDKAALYNGVY